MPRRRSTPRLQPCHTETGDPTNPQCTRSPTKRHRPKHHQQTRRDHQQKTPDTQPEHDIQRVKYIGQWEAQTQGSPSLHVRTLPAANNTHHRFTTFQASKNHDPHVEIRLQIRL